MPWAFYWLYDAWPFPLVQRQAIDNFDNNSNDNKSVKAYECENGSSKNNKEKLNAHQM